MAKKRLFTSDDLLDVGIRGVRGIVELLLTEFRERAHSCLRPLNDGISGKKMLVADKDAERFFERFLGSDSNGQFKEIEVYGEETLEGEQIDLEMKEGTFVLVDALDGSDLYERNLGNWCAAAVFFTPTNPPGQRIRAAIVGLPEGSIYTATDDRQSGTMVRREIRYLFKEDSSHELKSAIKTADPEAVRGCSRVSKLADASVCFYGQKATNLSNTFQHPMWRALVKLEREAKARRETEGASMTPQGIPFRCYNLGGIPMLVKMIDKVARVSSGIDAVVDFVGQKAHDIVPGAFLALRAGAHVCDLDGNKITIEKLEEVMLRPNAERLKYIIASSEKLVQEIVEWAKMPAIQAVD